MSIYSLFRAPSEYLYRFFNVMFAGCIPVIFGDDIVLPFHRLAIPYEKFVVRLPLFDQAKTIPPLFEYLEKLLHDGTADEMQQALWEWAPRFRFNLPFPETPEFPLDEAPASLATGADAFDGVMSELALRAAEVQATLRK